MGWSGKGECERAAGSLANDEDPSSCPAMTSRLIRLREHQSDASGFRLQACIGQTRRASRAQAPMSSAEPLGGEELKPGGLGAKLGRALGALAPWCPKKEDWGCGILRGMPRLIASGSGHSFLQVNHQQRPPDDADDDADDAAGRALDRPTSRAA